MIYLISNIKTLVQNNIISWYVKQSPKLPPYIPPPERLRPFRDLP